MKRRLQIYLDETGGAERFRWLALLLFPLWVAHFPVMRFVLPAWGVGLMLPLALTKLLRHRPLLRDALPLVLFLSSVVVFWFVEDSGRATIENSCRWLWLSLGYCAGHDFWTTSDPESWEQRQLASQLRGLNERLDETIKNLRNQLEEQQLD